MYFKEMNSGRFKFSKNLITFILIFSFTLTVNSCMTTNNYYTTQDSLEAEILEDINKIELKDGTIIKGKDKLIQLGKNADSTNYLIIWSDKQNNSKVKDDNSAANWSKEVISGNDIEKIQMTHSKINVTVMALLALGVIVTVTLISIGASNMKSIP